MNEDHLHDVGFTPRKIKGPIGFQKLRLLLIDRFAKVHKAEYYRAIQGYLIFMIIMEAIIYCQQLIFIDQMLFYKNGYGQLLKELFSDNLTQEKTILKNRLVIIYCYMSFIISKNVVFLGIVYWKPQSSVWNFFKNILYLVHVLEFSIGVVPILLLLTTNLNPAKTVDGIAPALVTIFFLIWQRLFMKIYEKDYHFSKIKIDLYDSPWTSEVRLVTDFIVMIVREAVAGTSSRNLILTSVFLLMQVIVIGFMVSRQFYYTDSIYAQVYLGRVSLLITMAIYLFLSSLSETIYGIVNLEVLLFSVFILITRVARNLYFRVRERIAGADIYSLKTAYEVEIKTNHLLNLYLGLIEKDQTSVELQQQMAGHIRGCKDPKCFCRIIMGKFNTNWYKTFDHKKGVEIGFRKKLQYVSNLEKIIFLENKQVVEQALSEQAEMDLNIEKRTHKEYQRKEIALLKRDIRNQDLLQKKIEKANSSNPDQIVDVVDVGSFHFKAVIYSFLVGMADRLKSFDSSYLLFSYCHFSLKNYAMVLLKGYSLLHSEEFQKQGSVYDLITLVNFLTMSSTEMRESQIGTKKWLTEADFGDVFRNIKKIDYLTYEIKELLQNKIRLLSHLINKDKDLKHIVELGEKIFLKVCFCSGYCDELLSTIQSNRRLLATALNYKVNIAQEWKGITKLKEIYLKLLKRPKPLFNADSLFGKKNINLLDSDKLIMTHYIKLSGIFINYFTKNVPTSLKLRPEKLMGMNIKEILPLKLKKIHDQKVFDYVNRRNNKDLTPMAAHGCIVDGLGNIQLYNVIAKIDVMFNDDIYFVSLMNNAATSKKAKFILFDQGIEPTGFTQGLKNEFPDILSKPSNIYNHIPLLIEVARTTLCKLNEPTAKKRLSELEINEFTRITKGPMQSVVLDIAHDKNTADNLARNNLGKIEDKRFIKITQRTQQPTLSTDKLIQTSANLKDITDASQAITKLKEDLLRWLTIHQKDLDDKEEGQRECSLYFSLHNYEENEYYFVAEVKNFKKIESKNCLQTIRQLNKKEEKEHLINLLLVESGMLQVICKFPVTQSKILAWN